MWKILVVLSALLSLVFAQDHPQLIGFNSLNAAGSYQCNKVMEYNQCYEFGPWTSVSSRLDNFDMYNTKFTVILYQTSNCGGDYVQFTGNVGFGKSLYKKDLGKMRGRVKSYMLQNKVTKNTFGNAVQKLPLKPYTLC